MGRADAYFFVYVIPRFKRRDPVVLQVPPGFPSPRPPPDATQGEMRAAPACAGPIITNCSEPVPGCTPCYDRHASSSFRGSSGHPARSRESPPATPEASARHAHPIYAADARPPPCVPRRSKLTRLSTTPRRRR